MIVESLYLLMGKKKTKILPNKFAIYEIKDLVMKKKDHNYYFIFSEDTIHVASPSSSKKKILSDFFFLLSFSPPKKLILLRSPSPFKNKTSKNEFNQNKLQLSRVGRAILLWTKKQLGDVDIELLIAAFPSFYRQYVIENPNSSLWWSSHTDDLPAFGF